MSQAPSHFASPEEADRVRKLPTPYQLFRWMTRSEHLHFGLFEERDEPFATAQERMMERLLSWLPTSAQRVLDVGCGIGGTSVTLAERGLRVAGIAPELALIDYAKAMAKARGAAERTEFHAARLQDLPHGGIEPFDVVLSQESLQYIHPLTGAMERLHGLLRPGGRLIVGDQVLRRPEHRKHVQFHVSEEILEAAAAAGLRLREHEDVTKLAIRTVSRSLEILEAERAGILAFFGPEQPGIEGDLDVCLHNGSIEAEWYENGWIGYELFAFDRVG